MVTFELSPVGYNVMVDGKKFGTISREAGFVSGYGMGTDNINLTPNDFYKIGSKTEEILAGRYTAPPLTRGQKSRIVDDPRMRM